MCISVAMNWIPENDKRLGVWHLSKISYKAREWHGEEQSYQRSPEMKEPRRSTLWGEREDLSLSNTHPFDGPLSGTTKGKTSLDFTEARDSEWQWHQLGHMQVCTSLQTDNHASTHHSVFYRPGALPAAQPTASKHWRHDVSLSKQVYNLP